MESKTCQFYIHRENRTVWIYDGLDWNCPVCRGSKKVCRGCGGMSVLYRDKFGSCGEPVACYNCVELYGPDEEGLPILTRPRRTPFTIFYFDVTKFTGNKPFQMTNVGPV